MLVSKYVFIRDPSKKHRSGEDIRETVEVLCHATATCVEGGISVKGAVPFRKIGFGGWLLLCGFMPLLEQP